MSKYYAILYTDDSSVKGWEDLNPDKIHHIDFKGKWYDEVRHGKWVDPEDPTCYRCSICGEYAKQEYALTEPIFWQYCPNCGAKMDDNWEELTINPCRGCEDYVSKGECISKGGCGTRMDGDKE